MEKIITIPKELAKKGELVVIPRSEYEKFLNWQKSVKIFKPTAAEKKAVKDGRREIRKGKYLTLQQLKDELED